MPRHSRAEHIDERHDCRLDLVATRNKRRRAGRAYQRVVVAPDALVEAIGPDAVAVAVAPAARRAVVPHVAEVAAALVRLHAPAVLAALPADRLAAPAPAKGRLSPHAAVQVGSTGTRAAQAVMCREPKGDRQP